MLKTTSECKGNKIHLLKLKLNLKDDVSVPFPKSKIPYIGSFKSFPSKTFLTKHHPRISTTPPKQNVTLIRSE